MYRKDMVVTMKEKLEKIKAEAIRQINMSDALDKLNDVRVNFLGKKGELTAVLKSMKEVAPEDRPRKLNAFWRKQRQAWKRNCAKRK